MELNLHFVVRTSWMNDIDYVYGPDTWEKCREVAEKKNEESLSSPYKIVVQTTLADIVL